MRMMRCIRRTFSTDVPSRLTGLVKTYNPTQHEEKVMERWKLRTGGSGSGPIFRMILPPPNVTGKLHLGHALNVAIQDAILRLKTMRGGKVEWIPGFDHAGIATHSVVSKKIHKASKDGAPIHPTFLRKELEDHARFNRAKIRKQLESLGALLNWDQEYYTLDEVHSDAVMEAFIYLHEAGVIRRGIGLVNWCYALQSSIADIEVDKFEFIGRTSIRVPGYDKPVEFGLLYYCAYTLLNTEKKIIVATSRPETMFGDVALAVHPEDSKYNSLIGQYAVNPLNGKPLPIIGDSRVKMNFGTGVVKITPAHDKLDFEIGKDNKFESINIFTPDGKLNDKCGSFAGLSRFKARKDVMGFLKDEGSLLEVADYSGSLDLCSRTQDVVESTILPHWFFKTKKPTEYLVSCIQNGEFIVRPENQQKMLLNKLEDVRDWCLSRQIQWGHPIPAFRHKDFPEKWVVALSKTGAKEKLETMLQIEVNDDDIIQDPDVLDTWFSSALIPLSLSQWPDLQDFKEISLLETGHDILLFWVWRMAIINLALVNKLPFHSVLLHGIVVDHYGRKMSKSRGNVIDPMHVILGKSVDELKREAKHALDTGELDRNEYDLRMVALKKDYPSGFVACGADAIRFSLLGQDISDQDVTIGIAYLENCKHFCNKLWQAMRMYLHYADNMPNIPDDIPVPTSTQISSLADRWLLACLHEFSKTYEENIRTCKFHLVTEAIRTFFYTQYCDVYLELIKKDLQEKKNINEHLVVMRYAFCTALKLAHPFLPFVTEEIWSVMTRNQLGLLIDANLPHPSEMEGFRSVNTYEEMNDVLKIVKEIRALKSRFFAGTKDFPNVYIETFAEDAELASIIDMIAMLSRANVHLDVLGRFQGSDLLGVLVDLRRGRSCRVSVARDDVKSPPPIIDNAKLNKLKLKLEKLKLQYESPSFQQSAPKEVKEKLRKKLETLQNRVNEANPNPDNPEHL